MLFLFVFVLLFPFLDFGGWILDRADWQGIQLVSKVFVWSNDT